VEIDLSQATVFPTMQLSPAPPGEGTATFQKPIPNDPNLRGTQFFIQFFCIDPQAAGGIAASPAAGYRFF
jgi:hypothetical protein